MHDVSVLDTKRLNPDSGTWVGLGVGEKPMRRLFYKIFIFMFMIEKTAMIFFSLG